MSVRKGQRPDVPAAPRRQDRGRPQGAAEAPRRPVPRLHPGRGPGLPGDRQEPRRRPPADHQAQHRRRRHRRVGGARAGQHRPGRGAAGDGGQGRAVQAVRRASTPGRCARHPGHRHDRRDRPVHRPRLRRDQPRGHRRAAVLRDRAPAARAARHPGLPRRPARHRHRGAGRADQRAAGRQEAPQDVRVVVSPGSAPPGTRSSGCCTHQGFTDIIGCDRNGAMRPGQPEPGRVPPVDRGHHQPPRRAGHPGRGARRCRRVHRGVRAEPADRGRHRDDGRRARSCSRWPTPTPRSTRSRRASTPRSWPPGARTTRTRSTTCSRSPGSSAGCSTPARTRSPTQCLLAAATAIADCVGAGELNANYIVPSVFDPSVAPAVAAAVRSATA